MRWIFLWLLFVLGGTTFLLSVAYKEARIIHDAQGSRFGNLGCSAVCLVVFAVMSIGVGYVIAKSR